MTGHIVVVEMGQGEVDFPLRIFGKLQVVPFLIYILTFIWYFWILSHKAPYSFYQSPLTFQRILLPLCSCLQYIGFGQVLLNPLDPGDNYLPYEKFHRPPTKPFNIYSIVQAHWQTTSHSPSVY